MENEKKENSKETQKLEHKLRKVIVNNLMMSLSEASPELYYRPTVDIAHFIWEAIQDNSAALNKEQKDLVAHLSARDIQILLGHHSDTRDHLL